MKVHHSARTDVGRTRDHNEDSYGVGEGEPVERFGELLVVCDGMGGHAAGEIASRVAVETIMSDYYATDDEERAAALEQAFSHANEQIYASGRGTMGTTGVAALFYHDALHIANVGDSRAYLIRDGEIRQLSRDHSFVSDQVAAGLITPEQARSSPHRNVITRALGYQSEVSVDLFRWPLQIDDIILLCSDGLHGLVTDEEIAEVVVARGSDEAIERLINLANERGGSDNITVAIARVDALDWDAHPVSEAEPVEEHATAAEQSVPESVVAPPAVEPAAPAPSVRPAARGVERRLTLLGGLLAMLLLSVLLFGILFALNRPAVELAPPTAVPALASTAAPSAGPTFAPSPAPTTSPTP